MNNIINLNDKRERSIESNYQILCEQARDRFSKLDVFKGQSYDSSVWRYLGENLYFSDNSKGKKRTHWPTEVEETIKLLTLGHLWDLRVRATPLSFSRASSFRNITPFLIKAGMTKLEDLTYDVYYQAFQMMTDHYAQPAHPLQDLNAYVKFLQNEYLLSGTIDTLSPTKNKAVQEKQGLPALKEKMPIPELVRAVIQLKWKVEEEFEQNPNNHRIISDLLSIYTQSFQYGLGLRIGEVLRLPHDCIQEVNGELFCKVWTEKGMTPHSRYIPKVWRSLLTDIVKQINTLTEPYRKHAIELEENKYLSAIRTRLEKFKVERRADAKILTNDLETFLELKNIEAQTAWTLKKTVDPLREYTLDELNDILPIYSTAKATPSKVKAYEKWELRLTVTPLGARKNQYSVGGKAILDFVAHQIQLRTSSITEQEFLTLLHGRDVHRQNSGDKSISALTKAAEGSTASCYTFNPAGFEGKGRAPALMSKDDAIAKLTSYAYGSYDITTHIDVLTFRKLFPEITLMSSNSDKSFIELNQDFDITGKQKITVKVKTEDQYVRYSVSSAFIISHSSIDRYVYNRFTDNNFALEKELYEADLRDANEDRKEAKEKGFEAKALTIQSKSFKVEQKVSEHLFLRSDLGTGGTEPNPLAPEILGYNAVRYFFTGNDRYHNGFIKYEVNTPLHVTETWQSHKGRHWRTTSLFRAGVSDAIVNRWMGRTELQGRHYDHNTGSERAKAVGELMLEDSNRFAGNIPQKIRQFQHDKIPVTDITEYLDANMQTAQHTPIGYCIRSLNLKPCELNMMCLVGSDGDGCKHYIFDLKDEYQRETLIAERDKTAVELERLIEVYENGLKAAKLHIDRHLIIYKNANTTLEMADTLLGTSFAETKHEFMPFQKNGSYPDDCPFQCGDD
ncbi:hypothetical protein [Neptunomonas japonica]|uniref:hypothetical protein n=1 Tax=Neptunomonas japonica TaxID=417574 RepID=UPI00041D52D7|nr:hypothetical protein [Neptunomonas japonica]